jgi:hypothetical protein
MQTSCCKGNNDQKQLRLDEERTNQQRTFTIQILPHLHPSLPRHIASFGSMRELGLKLCPRYTFSVSAQHDIHPNGCQHNPRGPRFFLRSFLVQVGHAVGKKKVISVELLFCSVRKSLERHQKPRCGGLLCFSFFIAAFGFLSNGGGGRGVGTCAVGV